MNIYFRYGIIFLILCGLSMSCSVNQETVPGDPGCEWSFVVFSDVQQGYGIYSKLAENIAGIRPVPSIAFCCGDLMLRPANEAEWERFQECSEPVTGNMPLVLARGNHEGTDPVSEQLLRDMGSFPGDLFYYSLIRDGCMFLILDTQDCGTEPGISDTQASWLKDMLDKSSEDTSVRQVFIFMHQPVFTPGIEARYHLSNSSEIHQLFTTCRKIRAVFSGHFHLFNKKNIDGINYIITGGGGGKLREGYGGYYHHFTLVGFYRDPERINLKTIGIFNEIIEDIDL